VEGFDEQVAQRLGQFMHILAQLFGPVDFHDDASLGRLDRIMQVGRDGCSACRNKATAMMASRPGLRSVTFGRSHLDQATFSSGLTNPETGLH
jgi:hypothetical protein